MAKSKRKKPSGEKKGPGAGKTFKKTDYGVSAELFVTTWEQSANVDEVFERLRSFSEKNGRPVMPKPIILSRATEYRALNVPLKKMPRVAARPIDAKRLTDLVLKMRGEKPAPSNAAVSVPPPPGLTSEQFEAVVEEVLRRLRARGS